MFLCTKMAGEWFKADTEAVISQALQTGAGPNVSDAYTINGLPGPLYNCSANGICTPLILLKLKSGRDLDLNTIRQICCYEYVI